MNIKLSRILFLLLFLPLLGACGNEKTLPASEEKELSVLLEQTEDQGQNYLDSFIFFGESTTYHMKDRGVLRGGKNTTQIWAPDNGTVNLDHTTVALPLLEPESGQYMTIGEAARKKRPGYLVLTFGLNGAAQNVRRGEEYYKSCYRSLLDTIREASPETKLILQSAPPVAENMDMSRYSVSVDTLNQYIETINGWVYELAEEYSLRYLNTAEILKDENGRLKLQYQVGDGHHLTKEAYEAILYYIRTHGYE